tara:strand:- start:4223 stop:4402 length:180 start_codon:yes stop_codon:yes gene_type:complete
MLHTKLVLVFKLLELLLWCLLVVFLILCGRFDALLKLFADEQDLAIFVVEILGLDFGPC